jgi:tetratricopeptide (TPR) repeat protein
MLGVARRTGDGARLAKALGALAHFHLARRQYDPARPLMDELASLYRSLNDRDGEASTLAELAFLNWRQGRFESVSDALQRAHELRRHLGDPSGLAQSYFDLGLLYRDGLSQAFYAANHFERAIELAHQSVAPLEQQGLVDLGVSWLCMGDKTRARMALDQAQRQIDAHGLPEQKTALLMALALLQHAGASGEASGTAARAVALSGELMQPDLEWAALCTRARIDQEREDWDTAQLSIDRMRGLEQNHALYAYCAIWSNALQARNHLYTGHPRAAVDASTYAIHGLQSHGQPGLPLPQMILWIHFEVLNHTHDQATLHFLRQARETMLAQANTIADSALRASFLRDVAINRSIGDQWARMHK